MLRLQNGSDIRGVALDNDQLEVTLTQDRMTAIAHGIIAWAQQQGIEAPITIAIGNDGRISAEQLKAGLIQGFSEYPVEILDMGVATTPAMFMATQFSEFDADIGIMLTASHLPMIYNGLKLFTKSGGAESSDIAYILKEAQNYEQIEHLREQAISVREHDLLSRYGSWLVEQIRSGMNTLDKEPLKDWHIVVDAGNGAGGFFVQEVLEQLGAKTEGSQFLEVDGTFPNHIPNPDDLRAMESIQQAVLDHQADLGIIFDTDVDRAAVVSSDGTLIHKDALIAVLAKIVLSEYPNAHIVTNSPTSSHLSTFIDELGGVHVRDRCGYRNVINRAKELESLGKIAPLAIETTGHAAFSEHYFLDDGAYIIAKLLMAIPKLDAEGNTFADWLSDLTHHAEMSTQRLPIDSTDIQQAGLDVIDHIKTWAKAHPEMTVDMENVEGVRVNVSGSLGSGWFLLRQSLHEPLLVLHMANDQVGGNEKLWQILYDVLVQEDTLKEGLFHIKD